MENSIKIYVDNLPKNSIIMWYGDIHNVPQGWAICNGKEGTPDLRLKFPIGADDSGEYSKFTKGKTGGAETVEIKAENVPKYLGFPTTSSGTGESSNCKIIDVKKTQDQLETGSKPIDILPPYLAVHYIIKIV